MKMKGSIMEAIVYKYNFHLKSWVFLRKAEVLHLGKHSISLKLEQKPEWWQFWKKRWEWYPLKTRGLKFQIRRRPLRGL